MKTIETHARAFFKVIIFSIGSVNGYSALQQQLYIGNCCGLLEVGFLMMIFFFNFDSFSKSVQFWLNLTSKYLLNINIFLLFTLISPMVTKVAKRHLCSNLVKDAWRPIYGPIFL